MFEPIEQQDFEQDHRTGGFRTSNNEQGAGLTRTTKDLSNIEHRTFEYLFELPFPPVASTNRTLLLVQQDLRSRHG